MNRENSEQKSIVFIDPNDIIHFEFDPELESLISENLEDSFETTELSHKLEEAPEDYIIKRKEDTRGRLAIIYMVFTFIIFLLGFAVSIVDSIVRQSSIVDNLQTILPLLSGIFLGTLGFVIGYYFKRRDE